MNPNHCVCGTPWEEPCRCAENVLQRFSETVADNRIFYLEDFVEWMDNEFGTDCPKDLGDSVLNLEGVEEIGDSAIAGVPMERKVTERGFPYFKFIDQYGAACSLQKSSLATEDAIWLGVDDPDPKILASKVMKGGTGWVKYPVPEDVVINTRMHLTVEQVKKLIPVLQHFVETGEV